jgi:hypothetical protein
MRNWQTAAHEQGNLLRTNPPERPLSAPMKFWWGGEENSGNFDMHLRCAYKDLLPMGLKLLRLPARPVYTFDL